MRSALCVTMLAVCFFALQCTAANNVPDGQGDDQRSGVPSTAAVTTTTTKQPLQVPLDAKVLADHSTPAALDVSPPAEKTPTTTGDPPTQKPPLQPSSTDQQDHQQLQQQQTNTGQGSGVKTKEDPAVIPPKVDNSHNQDASQSEPDVKKPDVPTLPQSPPAPPSLGQSQQQQTQKSQQSQTQQSNPSPGGAKSQGEIGNASQPGQIAPPTTNTAAVTEKKDDNAKETTTTTVAPTQEKSIVPTSTLQKETKRPQSVDNKDGSSGTSLLFALATLFMLAVIPVAPAF